MTLGLILQGACLLLGAAVGGLCLVLSARLRRLNDLENGLGGAIAVMAAEIARLEAGMAAARAEAASATEGLSREIERAKSERAYWTLQRGLVAEPEKRVLRRRRVTGPSDA